MKSILLFAMVVMSLPLWAQHSLSGIIVSNNYEPLAGATVFLPDINKGTISDADGRFRFDNLPLGEINVQVSFVGYATSIWKVVSGSETVDSQFVMQPTIMKTEAIVVSGGYNATQHENAIKIDLFDINPVDWRASSNFAEQLTRVPGVDMISKGSGVSKPVIRGLSMNDILILNNGVRYENYQYSSHHPLGIDEFGISDVEVIKGPASLLYGSDAIGGVMNFIKEKPAAVGTLTGDYNGGYYSNSHGYVNNIGFKGSAGNLFGSLRAGQKNHADYLQGGGNFVPNSRFREHSVKSDFGLSNKLGTFRIFYDYGVQQLGLVEDEVIDLIPERGRKPEFLYQELNTHLLSSQNKLYLGKFRIDLDLAYQQTMLAHLEEVDLFELQMQLATLTYQAKINLPAGPNFDLIAGFQGMNQKNNNRNGRETIFLPDAQTNNYSLFGMAQQMLGGKLRLQAGVRYDLRQLESNEVPGGAEEEGGYRAALDKRYGSFSGSVGATWQATPKLLFRTNLAAAYRAPNLAELTSNGPHELRFEIGNPDLNPEQSLGFDLSMHYHAPHITIDAALFRNAIANYIYIAPTGQSTADGLPVYEYSQSHSRLTGGEAGLHFHPQGVKWLHVESSFSLVSAKRKGGDWLPFIPAPKLNLEVRAVKNRLFFFHEAFVSVSLHSAFDQNKPAPEEEATSGYSVLDAATGGYLNLGRQQLFLGLSVSNIFDLQYIDHLSTLKESGFFNPGRNFALSVRVPFGLSR